MSISSQTIFSCLKAQQMRELQTAIVIGVLLVLSIMFINIGFWAFDKNQNLAEIEIKSAKKIVTHEAELLNQRIEGLVILAETLAKSPFLIEKVQASNQKYIGLSSEKINQSIQKLDIRWRESNEATEFVKSYLQNDTSTFLKQMQTVFSEGYGEIFATNLHGEMIGTTGKLTTLAHRSKYWWQGAFNQGSPRVFIDDRGFDFSVRDFVIGVVVPIWNEDKFLGILKANFRMNTVHSSNLIKLPDYKQQRIRLVRASGEVMPVQKQGLEFSQPNEHLSEKERQALSSKNFYSSYYKNNGVTYLAVAAPVEISWRDDENLVFGGKKSGIDQYKGNDSEGWFLVVDLVPSQTFGSLLLQPQVAMLLASFILVLLMGAWLLLKYRSNLLAIRQQISTVMALDDSEFLRWAKTQSFPQSLRLKKDYSKGCLVKSSELEIVLEQFFERLYRCLTHAKVQSENLNYVDTQLKNMRDSMQKDLLTGLMNRSEFELWVTHNIAHVVRHGYPLSLILLEMDHYEILKAQYRQEFADKWLRKVADLLKIQSRQDDILARVNEAQFALLLPSATNETALSQAKRILEQIHEIQLVDCLSEEHSEKDFKHLREMGNTTACIGITEFIKEDSLEQFFGRVESALYRAKDNGRDQISEF